MKKLKSLAILLITIMSVCFIPAMTSLAASAVVDLAADSTEVTEGDTVYVYINIDSKTTFGDFEADLTYDKNVLDYQGGADVITGGSGYLKISDLDNGQLNTSRKYALEFKALKVGISDITFSGSVTVYDENGNEMSVSSDSIEISVKAPVSASTDANLSSLVTSPGNLSPTFDKNVTDYSMKVDNEVSKLIISAIPEDEKATVSVSGNDILKEGQNKIVITVLAESGDIIEYTINVYREPAPTVTGLPVQTDTTTGAALEILQTNGITYAVINGKFKLVEPGSEIQIPKGYIKTDMTISGVTISVYVPEDDLQSEFVLLYAEASNGEAGFYQYDRVDHTLQRFMETSVTSDKYRSEMNRAAITIAILSAFCVLLLGLTIGLFLKQKRVRKHKN